MAAAVVADGGLLVGGEDLEIREHRFDRTVHPLRAVERGVEVRHVRSVVLVVVDLHRLGVDVRLECVERIRQVGQLVRHSFSFGRFHVQGYAAEPPVEPEVPAHAHVHRDHAARAEARAPRSSTASRAPRSRRTIASTRATSRSETRSSASSTALDRTSANQVYSELRALKVDLSFAIGGIKNHEIYFAHLGGEGGDPTGAIDDLIKRDFGSVDTWRDDLKATGMAGARLGLDGLRLGRAPPLQLHRRRPEHVPDLERDAAVALDTYEHAYFLDFQTDRGAYIEAFFANLDWGVVNGWIASYSIPSA